jgi:hypothetical protein
MESQIWFVSSTTKKLGWSWELILSLFESWKTIPVFLPESIRYSLQFNKWNIWYNEIKEMLSSKYDMIPVFLVAKFCQWWEKIEFVSKIMNTFNRWDFYVDLCLEYLKHQSHTIDAHKLQYLSLIWFATNNLFEKKIEEIDPNHQRNPVILLHWWLLGLKAVTKNYAQWILWDDVAESWWSRSTDSWLIEIQQIISFERKSYLLIDDTIQTGKTILAIEDQIMSKGWDSLRCVPFIIPK